MADTTLIRSLTLRNFLSYGDKAEPIGLGPLNVIIGANGSGKSNLIEATRLLRGCTADLAAPILRAGGTDEWIWKGPKSRGTAGVRVEAADRVTQDTIIHELSFSSVRGRLDVSSERIWDPMAGDGASEAGAIYLCTPDHYMVRTWQFAPAGQGEDLDMVPSLRYLNSDHVVFDQSVLSQRTDRDMYPELAWLAGLYRNIAVYAELQTSSQSPARRPQFTDLPQNTLGEDGSNLALVVSDLMNNPEAKRLVLDRLRRFNDRIASLNVLVYGGTAQLFIEEKGLSRNVPATRISDGTLRFLYLAAVLCHPSPPGVICLEEPEIGMHPDAVGLIAEMLVEASTRSQVIVTTHSDLLVSALSDHADAVLVCEMTEEGSRMKRLESAKLAKWLEKYSLGDLWLRGQIGGTRW